METKDLIQLETVTQQVELVKGEFTPSEAAHVISSLINEKINFHKLQRLQIWEGDHGCKTNRLDGRIDELENEKEIATQFIKSIRGLGKNLKIKGTLEISLAE
ncbi:MULTISPECIES: hypothetical protein [Aquimarina]|uniref:Uncharacterized protein n=1 Tax=Aquimarina rubra TaxID=1920033 RepID=A0ABW5LFR6_9FLAO